MDLCSNFVLHQMGRERVLHTCGHWSTMTLRRRTLSPVGDGELSAHLVDMLPPRHGLVSRAGQGSVQLRTAVLCAAWIRLQGGALRQRARGVVRKAEAKSLPEPCLPPLNHCGGLQSQSELRINVTTANLTKENHNKALASGAQGGHHA